MYLVVITLIGVFPQHSCSLTRTSPLPKPGRRPIPTRGSRRDPQRIRNRWQINHSCWKFPHTSNTSKWRCICSVSTGKVMVASQLPFDWDYFSGAHVNFWLFKYYILWHKILGAPKEKSYKIIYKVWRDSMQKWVSYEFSKILLRMWLQISAWKSHVKKTVIYTATCEKDLATMSERKC